jgi:2,5-diketo-D-gluconate reductase B
MKIYIDGDLMRIIKLPKIGLGTWMLKPKQAEFSIVQGVELGYRFIDTAQAYMNEKGVGKGLKKIFETTKLQRKDLIIATKIHPMKLRPKAAYKSTIKSLMKLQLEYVDIIYVHYPAFRLGYSHEKTLAMLGKLVDEGLVKQIGLSNFTPSMLDDAFKASIHPIFAHQIEMHPYLQQKSMIEYLAKKNINLIAYSPLGRGKVLQNQIIQQISKKNQISSAQVCLAWSISKGAIPIPKASSTEHLKDNFNTIQIKLTAEEIAQIDGISITKRYVHPPVVSPKEWKQQKTKKLLK